jgi:hypothetical protein
MRFASLETCLLQTPGSQFLIIRLMPVTHDSNPARSTKFSIRPIIRGTASNYARSALFHFPLFRPPLFYFPFYSNMSCFHLSSICPFLVYLCLCTHSILYIFMGAIINISPYTSEGVSFLWQRHLESPLGLRG